MASPEGASSRRVQYWYSCILLQTLPPNRQMQTAVITSAENRHSDYRKGRLFLVSSLALATAGISASLRANTAADLQRVFFDPIDRAHSAEMIANILRVPFLGFALTIAIGSPLLDYIGMRLLLPLSGLCFAVGMMIMIFAT